MAMFKQAKYGNRDGRALLSTYRYPYILIYGNYSSSTVLFLLTLSCGACFLVIIYFLVCLLVCLFLCRGRHAFTVQQYSYYTLLYTFLFFIKMLVFLRSFVVFYLNACFCAFVCCCCRRPLRRTFAGPS